MSDAEWRALTPRLLVARLQQQHDKERLANLRVGMIAAEIRNTLRGKAGDKVWTAADIFPDDNVPASTEDRDTEGIVAMFRRMGTDLNGN